MSSGFHGVMVGSGARGGLNEGHVVLPHTRLLSLPTGTPPRWLTGPRRRHLLVNSHPVTDVSDEEGEMGRCQ